MKATLANQLPRINLANDGSMQSAQVGTLKSGQQNASSVDSKSPMHSFELPTSSTLLHCSRVTGNTEVMMQVCPILYLMTGVHPKLSRTNREQIGNKLGTNYRKTPVK